MSKLPLPQNSTDPLKEKNSEEFYKLFQLPADIMTKLAADAGYIDTSYTTTSGPWIVRRKVASSSEDEQSFIQDEPKLETTSEKRRKNVKSKDPTLISITEILSNVEKQLKSKPDLSMKSIPQTIVKTNPANFIPVPIVQSATDMSYSNVKPQYVYQPIIQPDGKTYYQQFLILPGKVVSSGDADAVLRSSNDRSPFVQETLLDPKKIIQAEFSVTAPTFPPPVSTYQFSNIPPASSTVMTTSATSAYHARFIKSHSSDAKMAFQQEAPHQLHAQHSDTSLSHDTSRKPVEEFSHQRRSLSINKLPRSDEEEANTHIYQEYVAIPPKTFMKMTQTSPLRIRTIESHLEHTRNAETGKIHQLKRDEMTRMSVEQHIGEDKHSQSPFRDQKLRKVTKLRKVKKNIRLNDREEEMIDSVSEQHHKDVRKMPQTRYLERLPIAVPSKKQERTLASKTWKRKTHEPIDLLMSKDLESFEQKKDSEDEVTDVQMKKRKRTSGRTSNSKKLSVMDSGLTEMNDEKSENEPQHDETKSVTPFNVSRKVLRLNKLIEVPVSNVMDQEKNIDEEGVHVRSHVRKLRRKSKKTKEMEDESLQTSTLPSVSTTSSDELLRRKHCLNIRTFARQFGIDDIEEFARYQCAFIENYYPHMTCDKRKEYVAECKKYYEVQK